MVHEAEIAQATGVTFQVKDGKATVVEPGESWLKLIKNGTILRATVDPAEVPQPLNPFLIVTKPQRR